jgi:hypothetical protein
MSESRKMPARQPSRSDTEVAGSAVLWSAIVLAAVVLWTAADLHRVLSRGGERLKIPADGLRLDPARASAAQFELVPGIGPSTARRIVEHRDRLGARGLQVFDSDGARRWALDAVPGVGPVAARRAAPYLIPVAQSLDPDVPAVRP